MGWALKLALARDGSGLAGPDAEVGAVISDLAGAGTDWLADADAMALQSVKRRRHSWQGGALSSPCIHSADRY